METSIHILALISAATFLIGAIFQMLLLLGFPLADYSWGGKYKGALPPRMRLASAVAALLLLFMAFVVLLQAHVVSLTVTSLPTHVVVWIITAFMGLNTLGNLASKNKKEKILMTPLTGIAFVCCLLVSIYSGGS